MLVGKQQPYVLHFPSTGNVAVFKDLRFSFRAGAWLVALAHPSPEPNADDICYLRYLEWQTTVSLDRDEHRKFLKSKTGETTTAKEPVKGMGPKAPVTKKPHFNAEISAAFPSGAATAVFPDDRKFRKSLPTPQRTRLWWILRRG